MILNGLRYLPGGIGPAVSMLPVLQAAGQVVQQNAEQATLGAAYTLGGTAANAQNAVENATGGVSGVVTGIKWTAIGIGVVMGGLIALKGLETVREVFDGE